MVEIEARFQDNWRRSEQFCPSYPEELPTPVDWLETASLREHVRAGVLLAMFNPRVGEFTRAQARRDQFTMNVAFAPASPASTYLIEQIDALLQRAREAGDPLGLEASILRSAPDPDLHSGGGEFRLRRADPIAFSTWVAAWQRLFPEHPLDDDIIAAHERELGQRTGAERAAIEAAVAREVAQWPAGQTPPSVEFEMDTVLTLCEDH
jgi:hypothetical protein